MDTEQWREKIKGLGTNGAKLSANRMLPLQGSYAFHPIPRAALNLVPIGSVTNDGSKKA